MMEPMGQKKKRKALRELAGKAHERELTQALSDLEAGFKAWRKGEMSCFELSDLIHKFHDGTSRDIWKRYAYLKPDISVPAAVGRGILKEDEIPPAMLEEMKASIEFFRDDVDEGHGPPTDASD